MWYLHLGGKKRIKLETRITGRNNCFSNLEVDLHFVGFTGDIFANDLRKFTSSISKGTLKVKLRFWLNC